MPVSRMGLGTQDLPPAQSPAIRTENSKIMKSDVREKDTIYFERAMR
jgi:hypothetical protein